MRREFTNSIIKSVTGPWKEDSSKSLEFYDSSLMACRITLNTWLFIKFIFDVNFICSLSNPRTFTLSLIRPNSSRAMPRFNRAGRSRSTIRQVQVSKNIDGRRRMMSEYVIPIAIEIIKFIPGRVLGLIRVTRSIVDAMRSPW